MGVRLKKENLLKRKARGSEAFFLLIALRCGVSSVVNWHKNSRIPRGAKHNHMCQQSLDLGWGEALHLSTFLVMNSDD